VTCALPARLAPGSAYLFFNDAEFALGLQVWIVESLSGRVARMFADG
jgi:hypothetical protein